MDKEAARTIILTGFSTTGKSRIGGLLAAGLGWTHMDTDEEVVKCAGKSIEKLFAEEGEAHFRSLEKRALAEALHRGEVVISTGGGAVLDADNRSLMKNSGFVVCLEAAPAIIQERLSHDVELAGGVRPLLDVPDPLQRITGLKQERQGLYATLADWTVHTDHLSPDEVCREILRGWYYWRRGAVLEQGPGLLASDGTSVVTPTEHYRIVVEWGLLERLGHEVARAGLSGKAFIVTDGNVAPLYAERVAAGLRNAGLESYSYVVAPGENSKTLETAARLYDWLVEFRAERRDLIVALGGGVIGDLAGFTAATFLRGMPLVQVPTSLAAMVDASIGGKTAVNHVRGKNLIGLFYQPRLVAVDTSALLTLPRRELVSGWAEVVKHGLILDAAYFEFIESQIANLQKLDPDTVTQAVRGSAAIKATIVSEDEKETGRRTLLNYGHTIGHGLEGATGYGRYLHGEAVAIGMAGAAMLSRERGMPASIIERQNSLLAGFGLPLRSPGVSVNAVLEAMRLDKKVQQKGLRWVLLENIGRAYVCSDISPQQVNKVLERLLSA